MKVHKKDQSSSPLQKKRSNVTILEELFEYLGVQQHEYFDGTMWLPHDFDSNNVSFA